MKKTAAISFITSLLVVSLLFCSRAERRGAGVATDADSPAQARSSEMAAAPQATGVSPQRNAAPSPDQAAAKPAVSPRMVIRTGNLSLIVKDSASALHQITRLVTAKGGYVTSSRQYREGEQIRAQVTLRIPSESFDGTMDSVRKLAMRVEEESVTGEDVTEEFSDLGARLVNLEATETELRELLKTIRQRVQKAADVLEVHRELASIRQEVERVKGRMQYLSTLTSMSTINVNLIPDVLAKPVVEPGWQPLAIFREAARALVGTLKWLAGLLIWLAIYVLPVMLLFALPVWILVKIVSRRRRAAAP